MPQNKKPTYEQLEQRQEELEQRLAEAEQMLDALRRGEVDAVLAQEQPIVLWPRELERKLKESETALVEAQTTAKIGSWQYEVAQDKPIWSQEMFRIFDRDPAQGEPPWWEHKDFFHPEDWERLDQAVRDAIEKGRLYREEFRVIRRDGSVIWAETIGKAHRNEAGKVFSLSGTVQDINERKKAELALSENEKKYRRLTDNSPDMIYRMSLPDGKYDFVSRAAETLTGYPPDTWYANPLLIKEIIPPDWHSYLNLQWSRLQKGEVPPTYEYQLLHKNGEVRWINQRNVAVRDEQGQLIAIEGILNDITQRKEAELALADSEEKFRTLYASIRDAILIAGTDRNILDCNIAFTDVFGYTLDEIRGQATSVLYESQEEFARMGREIQEHLKDRTFVATINYRRKDGKVFPGETSVYYQTNDRGEVVGLVGIIRDISAKVAAEKELRESRDLLHRTEAIAKIGGWELDAKTLRQKWTDGIYRIHEVDPDFDPNLEEAIEFYAPEARPVIRHAVEQALEKGEPYNLVLPFITAKGRHLWVRAQGEAKWENGAIVRIGGTFQDITAQKSARNQLRLERDLSKKYLDTAGVILLALDKQGRIELINRKGCQLLGCRVEEAVGQDWFTSYIPEDSRQRIRAVHENIMAGMVELHTYEENTVISDSGEQRLIRWFNTVIKDSESNITGTLSSGEDITEYKAAQEAINRLAAIVESSQDAITGKDLQGIITSWNDAAERIYGYTAEEAIGQHISLIVPEDKRGEVEQVLTAVGRGEAIRIHETVRRRKDGSLVDVSLSVSPVRDDQEQLVGAATIAHEITELKWARREKEKLESQLRQAQKMEAIGTLAGGIAHDFNNILAAIMGYSELAQDSLPADSEAAENIKTVIDSAQRAKELTCQILSFSRQTEHEQVALDLEPIIKEILKMLRATIPTTIEIKQNIPVGTGKIMADPVQIHQILLNLCNNAAQAMEETGGVLSVDLDVVDIDELTADGYVGLAPGRYQRLSVGDTGVGMKREVQERIFEPFYTTKDVGKGTGMGLSVVHGIVNDYGGAITVYSEPGEGSTFHVYLPLAEAKPDKEQASSSPPELRRGSESILFVDDEPALVDIGKQTLSRLGYKVQGFTSAQEALEAFQSAPDEFDLLITDFTMSKMNGVQLASEILAIKPDLPIIMCTGFSERLSSVSSQEIGVTRLALKPLMPRDIARIIREVLDKDQTHS
ncbi:PAS domain S-box protein [Desulfoferula mesophila]|uniref:histidine kinase n=1 Tax=Desulfoferula mesophila TaxID=3058419 RepID=A0AAU9EDZ6_9BACT|nr:hypothetical protein FAK_23890 [Desulfoferula mesophilus]